MTRRFSLLILPFVLVAAQVAAEVIHIDNQQLEKLLAQDVSIVDVRTPAEWKDTGVVKGSHLLMFFDRSGRYDLDRWLQDLRAVAGPGDPIILICRTGSRTSSISAYLDQRAGYTRVYNVRRGITRWIAEGHPTIAPGGSGR